MEIIPAISVCIEYPVNDVSVTPFTSTANISSRLFLSPLIDGFGAPHPEATVGSGVKYVVLSRVGFLVFFGAFVGFGAFVFGALVFGAFVGFGVFGAFVGFGFFVFGALVGFGALVFGALVDGIGSPHPD